jgi:hypothetical protein
MPQWQAFLDETLPHLNAIICHVHVVFEGAYFFSVATILIWISIGTYRIDDTIDGKLIDCLQFYVPLKNFSLIWRRHLYRWRAAKFRPMLGGPLSREGFYRATPAVTRASVFPVSSEGPPYSVAFYDTQEDVEDLF